MTEIAVIIPVGPRPSHQRWLDECLQSVHAQTRQADEILVINDMAAIDSQRLYRDASWPPSIRMWLSPWLLGVPAALNFGVALSSCEWNFMLGSDDRLMPDCLEQCEKAIQGLMDYLWVGVEYSDDRDDQFVPCGAAMVSKHLWRATGGFPPETGVGAPDAAFISTAMGNKEFPARIRNVNGERPLYWYRVHDETDTAGRGPYQGAILDVRNILTRDWKPPSWGRYE